MLVARVNRQHIRGICWKLLAACVIASTLLSGPLLAQWSSNGNGVYYATGTSDSLTGVGVVGSDNHWLYWFPSLGNGSYNGIVEAGDGGIIYSGGSPGSGGLVLAPWLNGTGGIRMDNAGNVGIGTAAPQSALDVTSGGIGIHGNSYTTGGPALELGVPSSTLAQVASVIGSTRTINGLGIWGNPITFYSSGGTSDPLVTIFPSGKVGIGTANPEYPLSVNGIVQAKEVIVNTGWSDYVFDPGYRVRPLEEVAAYVKLNRHLPDIPSAKEVETNGVSLGDMQSKLLAKVEELTLQMIELNEKNKRLEGKVAELESERKAQ